MKRMKVEQKDGPVVVPKGVTAQLESVRRTGQTNMADINGVQQVADLMGFHELFLWCEDVRGSGKLGMGCFVGFVDEN